MNNKKIGPVGVIKLILTVVITIGIAVLGGICNDAGYYNEILYVLVMILLSLGLVASAIISSVMKKRFADKIDRVSFQDQLLSQREKAGEIAAEKLALLKKMIKTIDICSVLILLSVCVLEFCFFSLTGVEGSGAAFAFFIGVNVGLGFIREKKVVINEKKSDDYLPEAEYPLIYGMARRAADAIGCEGRIKIFVDHDFNAGIMTIADGYSVVLGSYLLDSLSQDELYNILLHEFAHVDEKNDDINDVKSYANLLNESNSILEIPALPLMYLYGKFFFEYMTYNFVCSIMYEDAADAAMKKFGTPEVAASALIKTKFSTLYDWERNTYDEDNIYEPEEVMDDCVRKTLGWYRERVELRRDDWIKMIDSEILARNASHSTVKMRIESLGIEELKLLPKNDSSEYLAEVERAILHLEAAVKKGLESNYDQMREANYLQPKKILEEWENAGKPLTRENYQGIIISLLNARKIGDFVNLCCQVIEEIPEPANYYAHHMYGIYLLHCYDERGLDHLYKSIELNHNVWDEALEHIGLYACLVGKQDELDKYREKARELANQQDEIYEKMDSLTPTDKLVEEKLPDGMINDLLFFLAEANDGVIDSVYMVRKIISEEHFVTCVIVKPKSGADIKAFGEAMERIFQYLDKSSSWQYSLFDIRMLVPAVSSKVKKHCIYKSK